MFDGIQLVASEHQIADREPLVDSDESKTLTLPSHPIEATLFLILGAVVSTIALAPWWAEVKTDASILPRIALSIFAIATAIGVAFFAIKRFFPTQIVFERSVRSCRVLSFPNSQETIPFDEIVSVNLLTGQQGIWQAAWLCLGIRDSDRFVVVVENYQWSAVEEEGKLTLKERAKELSEWLGCPIKEFSKAHPAMKRRALEKMRS